METNSECLLLHAPRAQTAIRTVPRPLPAFCPRSGSVFHHLPRAVIRAVDKTNLLLPKLVIAQHFNLARGHSVANPNGEKARRRKTSPSSSFPRLIAPFCITTTAIGNLDHSANSHRTGYTGRAVAKAGCNEEELHLSLCGMPWRCPAHECGGGMAVNCRE